MKQWYAWEHLLDMALHTQGITSSIEECTLASLRRPPFTGSQATEAAVTELVVKPPIASYNTSYNLL